MLFRDGKQCEKKSGTAVAHAVDEMVTVDSAVRWAYMVHSRSKDM